MALVPISVERSGSGMRVLDDDQTGRRVSAFEVVKTRILPVGLDAPALVQGDGSVLALLYRDELAALQPEERPQLAIAGGGPTVMLRRAQDAPLSWDGATVKVRFECEQPAACPAANTIGWVELPPRPRPLLVVSESALLSKPGGPTVLLADASGELVPRAIEIGRVANGLVTVSDGLRAGDRVAVGGVFLAAAAQTLRSSSMVPAGTAR